MDGGRVSLRYYYADTSGSLLRLVGLAADGALKRLVQNFAQRGVRVHLTHTTHDHHHRQAMQVIDPERESSSPCLLLLRLGGMHTPCRVLGSRSISPLLYMRMSPILLCLRTM